MLYVSFKASENLPISDTLGASCVKLRIKKITRAIAMDGMVVYIKKRMCVKSGVPLDDAAMMVVSESGDTLSPK